MNDTATPDVSVVSSPTTPDTTPSELPSLDSLSKAERQEWRKTGEIPAPQPDDSATSTETRETPQSEPAPASQPDSRSTKPKNAETRKAELTREIQELLKQRDTLKREVQPGEPAAPPPASAQPAQPAAAQPKPEQAPADPEPTDRLNPATGKPWKDWNEFDQAKRAWDRREAVREVQRITAQTEQHKQAQEQQKRIADQWTERVTATVKDLGVKPEEYERQVTQKLLPNVTPVIAQFLLASKAGPRVAWYLAENPSIAQQVKSLDWANAALVLARIEVELTAKPSDTPSPKITRTPKPATDLGARNAAPADEEEAAVAQGDFRRFKSVANSRSLRK